MKRKILLVLAMVAVLAFTLAFAVSAESVHSGKVDLSATVTLDDGTECALFDEDGNALIWYKDASGSLQSIRADDERVKYKATYGFGVGNSTVGSVYAYEVSDMWIALESGNISKVNIVVLNLMDDDVLVNEATNNGYLNGPVNCVKTIQWANKVLEYAYLRLDTVAIQSSAFSGCPKLKYVNVAQLTELRQISGGSAFSGCTEFFKGQVLDLTGTKLITIGGNGTFNNVPISGIMLPQTVTSIGSWNMQGTSIVSFTVPLKLSAIEGSQFNDCKSLATIYISNGTTTIADRAFNNTVLEKIFFVGTYEELNTLLDNTGVNYNAPFWDVVGENRANLISYADYLALEDKSGKYVVYDYSYCEAYANGEHELTGSVEMQKDVNFFKDIVFLDACTVCGSGAIDESLTIGALFISKGVSAKTFGADIGLVQGYEINMAAIDAYKAYAPDFNFGVLAYANVDGTAVAPKPGDNKVVNIVFDNTANCYLEVKVTGIPADYLGTPIVFCIYATEGDKFYYLDNGNTTDTIVGSAYNEFVD